MVKKLIVLTAFIALLSCGRTENAYNELTDAERAALRARAALKCNSNNTPLFSFFKTESAEMMFTSDSYRRDTSWTFKYKKSGATDTTIEGTVQVYTRGADFIIFYVEYSKGNEDLPKYFLKLSKATQDTMINQLQTDYCASPAIYTGKSINDSSATVVYEYRPSTSGATVKDYDDRVTFNFNEPIFFGGYRINRTVQSRARNTTTGEIDEDTVTATETFTSTLEAGGLPEITQPYTNTAVFTQKFCEYTTAFRLSAIETNLGIPDPDSCVTALPGTWNMTVNEL